MNSRFSTNFVQVKLKEISNTAKILQRLQFCWIIHHSCEQSKNSQKNSQQTKSHIQYYSSQPRVFINTQFSTTIAIPSPVHYTTTINQNYSIFWSLTGTNFFSNLLLHVLSYFPISSRFYKNSDRIFWKISIIIPTADSNP